MPKTLTAQGKTFASQTDSGFSRGREFERWIEQITNDSNTVVNVRNYGALGDGVTDDLAAFNAALAVMKGKGGVLLIPPGNYKLSGSLTIPSNAVAATSSHALIIRGAGNTSADTAHGTYLNFAAGGIVGASLEDVHFEDFSVNAGPSAGPCLSLTTSINVWVKNVTLVQNNPAQPIVKSRSGTISLYFSNFKAYAIQGASQPAFDFIGSGGNLNNLVFEQGTVFGSLSSTAPLFRFEATSGIATNINFRDVVLETPLAGGIHYYSCQRCVIHGLWAGDLGATPPTAPLLKIAQSSTGGSIQSQSFHFSGVQTDIGDVTNATIDAAFQVGGQGALTVSGSKIPYVNNHGPGANPIIQDGSTLIAAYVGDPPNGINSTGDIQVNRINMTSGSSTGTPGSATLNTGCGKSVITAGLAKITITNSLVTSSTLVRAWVQQSTTDATLTSVIRTAASSGAFDIVGNAAATANVTVGWEILN